VLPLCPPCAFTPAPVESTTAPVRLVEHTALSLVTVALALHCAQYSVSLITHSLCVLATISVVLSTPCLVMSTPLPLSPSLPAPSAAPAPALRAHSLVHALSSSDSTTGVMPAPNTLSAMLTDATSIMSVTCVNATSPFAAVVEIERAEVVTASTSAAQISAQSLAPSPQGPSQCASPQALACRDGRDNREKQISTPSPAQIASTPKTILLSSSSSTRSSHSHHHHSSPASSACVQHVSDVRTVETATTSPSTSDSSSASARPADSSLEQRSPHTSTLSVSHPTTQSDHVGMLSVSVLDSSAASKVSLDSTADHQMADSDQSSSSAVLSAPAAHLPSLSAAQHSMSSLAAHQHEACGEVTPLTNFFGRLKLLYNDSAPSTTSLRGSASEATAAAAAAAATASSFSLHTSISSSSSSMFDLSCHCLVVDSSKLTSGSADETHLNQALALLEQRDRNKVLEFVHKQWLIRLPASSVTIAYVDPEVKVKMLHLNFDSVDSLSAALQAYPFLSRCGTLTRGASWGRQAKCCGQAKHLLPEMLQLRCSPSVKASRDVSQLTEDINKLIKEMQLESSLFWIPSRLDLAQQQDVRYIIINILPRCADLSTLSEIIERTHNKHQLWGGTVRVHAPNMSALRRCGQCSQLGHDAAACPQYHGLAIRLLFKLPVPFQQLTKMQSMVHAARAYLGRGFEDSKPHRKVTLLFDLSTKTEVDLAHLYRRLEPLLALVRHQLHQEPTEVDPMQRHKECCECGTIMAPHTCPFFTQPLSLVSMFKNRDAARPRAGVGQAARAQHGGVDLSSVQLGPSRDRVSGSSRAATHIDKAVCKTWRRLHSCPRGAACLHPHPPDHVPTGKEGVCFAFRDTGFCAQANTCRFTHVSNNASVDSAQRQSSPTAAAAAAAAAPTSASLLVSSSAAVIAVPAQQLDTSPLTQESVARHHDADDEEKESDVSRVAVSVTAPVSSSAPAVTRTPAVTPSRKRRLAAASDTAQQDDAQPETSDDVSVDTGQRGKKVKKTLSLTAASAIPVHQNSFAAAQPDDDDDDMEDDDEMPQHKTRAASMHRASSSASAAASVAPVSSLSSLTRLSSPTKPAAPRRSESSTKASKARSS
jgi:hypothetical protein